MMHKCLDPDWKNFAASYREGDVYVKMPLSKARALLLVWQIVSPKTELSTTQASEMSLLMGLLLEETEGTQEYGNKSVFYSVTSEVCRQDVSLLKEAVEPHDATGIFKAFRETLELGLKNDPQVDWISRVGGPARDPLACLEREEEDPADLFEFDFSDLNV